MYLRDIICNVLNFSVFDHTSCRKHDVLCFGVEGTNSIDVHEVTENYYFLLLIKGLFRNTFNLNRIHVSNLATHCFAF